VTDGQEDLRDLAQIGDVVIANLPDLDLPPNLRVEQLFSDPGLFSLLGEPSKVTIASDFAPAGADLVLETTVDLREVGRTTRKIDQAFGPEVDSEIQAAFKEESVPEGKGIGESLRDKAIQKGADYLKKKLRKEE
jgi:hypothetical protein